MQNIGKNHEFTQENRKFKNAKIGKLKQSMKPERTNLFNEINISLSKLPQNPYIFFIAIIVYKGN